MQTTTPLSHSPQMLKYIREQIADPVYNVDALVKIRAYYEQREKYEVCSLINEEIEKRNGKA